MRIEYQIVPLAQKLRKEVDNEKFLQEWRELLGKWGSAGWELTKVVPVGYLKSGGVLGGIEVITMQRFLLIFKREIQ